MDRIAAAERFLERGGRDVDRARFAYHFRQGSREELLEVLARYQNSDGGFGRGLEVDIAAPDSNPFATELALLICLQAGVPADHPLPARTVAYLEGTQEEDGTWRFSEAVYRGDMAPWFRGWTWPNLAPSCSIAGLLRELGLGSPRLHGRVEELFRGLAKPEDLLGDDFYAVRPYAFYFLPECRHSQRELYISGVLWWLLRQRAEGKLADASHFFEFVRSPDTYTGRHVPESTLNEELDRLEGEQADDGGWPTPYDERWRGPVTVNSLLVLKEFGRL